MTNVPATDDQAKNTPIEMNKFQFRLDPFESFLVCEVNLPSCNSTELDDESVATDPSFPIVARRIKKKVGKAKKKALVKKPVVTYGDLTIVFHVTPKSIKETQAWVKKTATQVLPAKLAFLDSLGFVTQETTMKIKFRSFFFEENMSYKAVGTLKLHMRFQVLDMV